MRVEYSPWMTGTALIAGAETLKTRVWADGVSVPPPRAMSRAQHAQEEFRGFVGNTMPRPSSTANSRISRLVLHPCGAATRDYIAAYVTSAATANILAAAVPPPCSDVREMKYLVSDLSMFSDRPVIDIS